MTIAGRINLLFISAALVLALVLTAFTAWREYRFALDRTVDAALARALAHPELQFEIYQRDQQALQALLAGFLETPAVAAAVALDGLDEVLAEQARAEGIATAPPFKRLRSGLSAADTSLVALDANMQPAATGLWSAWTDTELPMYLTLPVLTAANPGQQGLTAYDFFVAPLHTADNSSQRIIGYLQLAISRAALLDAIGPAVARVFFASLGLIALCGVGIALMTRRITRDLSRLSRMADEVAAGEWQKPVEISAGGEIREIANVLNQVITGFTRLKQEAEVGSRLLARKVDERTSQLSSQEQALNQAEEEINQSRDRLQRMAYYDSLTALPNRHLFTEQLDLLLGLSQRNGQTLALLFLNLDNFKRINDSLGYGGGDRVLLEVSKRLSDSVRGSDPVGHNVDDQRSGNIDVSRLGGDEFTVVLNQLDQVHSAGTVAQRLLEVLQRPMNIDGHELVVSPSIGVAIAPRDGADMESLLRAAGIAMHHAKASVRDKVLFYGEHMDATGVGRLRLEADLRKALERNELALHYQSQVNTVTGAVVGAEALLRWEHPEYGTIPPFQFIPLAEEMGVIRELGQWVLAEACRQLQEFDRAGLVLPRIAVNVSAFQFSPTFCAETRDILQQFGLSPSRLELGLSEAILLDDDRNTFETLKDLKAMGVHLAVDNFGASYAPLGYLSRHALDELKIDRSFSLDCDRNERNGRLVLAIIAMARSLGLGLVAEGVESEAQCRFLIRGGVQVVQGYLFGAPVPAAKLAPLLAPWHFVEQVQAIQAEV